MDRKTDVLIVGGGPAGSAAAYFLAKAGIDFLLVEKEKFPREKPCGGGLTANSVDVLKEVGLLKKIETIPHHKFSGYKIHSANRKVIYAPFGGKNYPCGFVIRRPDFDNLLLNHAMEAGTEVIAPISAVDLAQKKDGSCLVNLSDGSRVDTQIVVVADGSGGSFSRKVNRNYQKAETIAIRGYFENVQGLGSELEFLLDDKVGYGYGWIFPLGPTTANVGAGADVKFLKKRQISCKELFEQFTSQLPLKQMLAKAKLVGKLESYPLRMAFPKRTLVGGRIIFIGDAANLIYPLTGEGISYAIKSGRLAAKAVVDTLNSKVVNYRTLESYRYLIKREFADFKLAYYLKETLCWPPFQRLLFNTAAKDKRLGELAIGILENTVSCRKLLRPGVWLCLLRKGLF